MLRRRAPTDVPPRRPAASRAHADRLGGPAEPTPGVGTNRSLPPGAGASGLRDDGTGRFWQGCAHSAALTIPVQSSPMHRLHGVTPCTGVGHLRHGPGRPDSGGSAANEKPFIQNFGFGPSVSNHCPSHSDLKPSSRTPAVPPGDGGSIRSRSCQSVEQAMEARAANK